MNKSKSLGYTQAKRMLTIQCQNCGQGAKPNAPIVAVGVESLLDAAQVMHNAIIAQTKMICATPKLIIEFASVLIHDSLILQPETNGKG